MIENFIKTINSLHGNQKYDNYSYSYHLASVSQLAEDIISEFNIDDLILSEAITHAAYAHDCLEDCAISYNELKDLAKQCHIKDYELLADIVYAVTNEKGKTRSERQSDKFYLELAAQPFASFIKVVDRTANMKHSKLTGSSMFGKYKKELDRFLLKVLDIRRDMSTVELYLLNKSVECLRKVVEDE